MKRTILAVVAVAALTMAGCGDGGNISPVTQVDRPLSVEITTHDFPAYGNYSTDVTGFAPSSSPVVLSVPQVGNNSIILSPAPTGYVYRTTVVTAPSTDGAYQAKMYLYNVPPGTYQLKAFTGAFTPYSTAVSFNVR